MPLGCLFWFFCLFASSMYSKHSRNDCRKREERNDRRGRRVAREDWRTNPGRNQSRMYNCMKSLKVHTQVSQRRVSWVLRRHCCVQHLPLLAFHLEYPNWIGVLGHHLTIAVFTSTPTRMGGLHGGVAWGRFAETASIYYSARELSISRLPKVSWLYLSLVLSVPIIPITS